MTDSTGTNLGTEVGNYYKALLAAGILPHIASDMTRDFADGLMEAIVNT